MCDDEVAALVVDNGSGMCKVILCAGRVLVVCSEAVVGCVLRVLFG